MDPNLNLQSKAFHGFYTLLYRNCALFPSHAQQVPYHLSNQPTPLQVSLHCSRNEKNFTKAGVACDSSSFLLAPSIIIYHQIFNYKNNDIQIYRKKWRELYLYPPCNLLSLNTKRQSRERKKRKKRKRATEMWTRELKNARIKKKVKVIYSYFLPFC